MYFFPIRFPRSHKYTVLPESQYLNAPIPLYSHIPTLHPGMRSAIFFLYHYPYFSSIGTIQPLNLKTLFILLIFCLLSRYILFPYLCKIVSRTNHKCKKTERLQYHIYCRSPFHYFLLQLCPHKTKLPSTSLITARQLISLLPTMTLRDIILHLQPDGTIQ